MEPKRILLVDDEERFTRLVKMSLEKTGAYVVRTENHARLALPAAQEFQPQMIFLDVMMPGMDGAEVATRLRADPKLRATPIVFLTAIIARDETRKGELTSGGEQFLAKPVTLAKLIECIERHLGAH